MMEILEFIFSSFWIWAGFSLDLYMVLYIVCGIIGGFTVNAVNIMKGSSDKSDQEKSSQHTE